MKKKEINKENNIAEKQYSDKNNKDWGHSKVLAFVGLVFIMIVGFIMDKYSKELSLSENLGNIVCISSCIGLVIVCISGIIHAAKQKKAQMSKSIENNSPHTQELISLSSVPAKKRTGTVIALIVTVLIFILVFLFSYLYFFQQQIRLMKRKV